MQKVIWHPKGKQEVSSFSEEVKSKLGYLIYRLQLNEALGLPQSRPISSVGRGVKELRLQESDIRMAKMKVSKTVKDLAKDLGFPPSKAVEWQVRHQLTKKIGKVIKKDGWTITDVAKAAKTSRARVTDVVKENTEGISIDVLLRILGSLGESVKISFKKVS